MEPALQHFADQSQRPRPSADVVDATLEQLDALRRTYDDRPTVAWRSRMVLELFTEDELRTGVDAVRRLVVDEEWLCRDLLCRCWPKLSNQPENLLLVVWMRSCRFRLVERWRWELPEHYNVLLELSDIVGIRLPDRVH